MRKVIAITILLLTFVAIGFAQVTVPYEFTAGSTISSSQVNANFDKFDEALNRTGGTLTGNMTVSANVTIDGLDLSDYLTSTQVLAAVAGDATTPAFAMATDTNTGLYFAAADSLGITLGGTSEFTITATTTTWPSSNLVVTSGNLTLSSGNLSVSGTSTLTGAVVSNLIFTDNTYDIGASGATRPRDIFVADDVVIADDLTVADINTLTGTMTASGASPITLTGASAVLAFSGATAPSVTFSGGNGQVASVGSLVFHADYDTGGSEAFNFYESSVLLMQLSSSAVLIFPIDQDNAFVTYGGFAVHLDEDNDTSNTFTILDGANATVFSIAESGLITTASVNAASIADGTVATADLKTATNSATSALGSTAVAVAMADYSFFPNIELDDCTGTTAHYLQMVHANQTNDFIGQFSVLEVGAANCSAGSWDVRYRYMTASDNPDIWVMTDGSNNIVGVWEGEDPTPGNMPGITASGYTSTRLEVPTVAEINTLYAGLGSDRQAAEAALLAYLAQRGWVDNPQALVPALNAVPARYDRAARLWAVRKAAAAIGVSPAELIMETMEPANGRIRAKDSYASVVAAHKTARAARLAANQQP